MKYYTDGFMTGSNPSPIGGGYTIVDENNVLVHREVILQSGFTNNEAETRGIIHALRIANNNDTISTDSMCCLTWINSGKSKARPDLYEVLQEGRRLLKEKNINLMWEGREFNLAGIQNEQNLETKKKYKRLMI